MQAQLFYNNCVRICNTTCASHEEIVFLSSVLSSYLQKIICYLYGCTLVQFYSSYCHLFMVPQRDCWVWGSKDSYFLSDTNHYIIQFTLEQQGFELQRFTYMQIFFCLCNPETAIATSPLYPQPKQPEDDEDEDLCQDLLMLSEKSTYFFWWVSF